MKNFKTVNKITGWIIFLISATVYLLTIEPSTSFWDCGEFIATAFKLEVGHPPGAPLFMIIARFFALFAGNDVSKVAMMVNAMSGLASAFTILFLFWTITHLAKKMFSNNNTLTTGQLIVVIGSGVVGSLAYTFSDTFWFSAVEGEVYALSSFFTAIVFWAILKWENEANEKYANRWIILIAYLMGLSIGVHLLNLLAIPAIVLVYYFKKYEITRNGILKALLVSILILGTIMYIIIPGFVKVATWFELLFVNSFGLPFKSGLLFYIALLIAFIVWSIRYTHKKGKVVLNTIALAFTVIMIGYSSFTMIVVRSMANPPMDENNPETVFNLLHYLNREQYGNRPLVTGQYYNAPITGSESPYTYRQKDGKYIKCYSLNDIFEYDERFSTFFPRMYSQNQTHIDEYKKWANVTGKKISVKGYNGKTEVKYVPTFSENLKFFFDYQIGHMYLRYFMWNFAGRQNDTQGHGEIMNGNWITGFNFIDKNLIGSQKNFPDDVKNNKSRNVYYLLPLILGLIGFFFHTKKRTNDSIVIILLFILTGIAIVVYLNQPPLQPRERDYAYAGSFYAFAIWIGLGVLGVYDLLSKKLPKVFSAGLATTICLIAVPAVMASENWDDHDRSNRYIARDIAANYLNSCAPNAILFTYGDNDTFPLWYAQEVEGIRTDVRVVNLSLLNTHWYIDQMRRKAYDSDPVPFSLKHEQYLNGTRDVVYINERIKQYVEIKDAVAFAASDNKKTRIQVDKDEWIDYLPTSKLILKVDSAVVVNNRTVKPENADKIEKEIRFKINKNRITKNELMILDLLATNNWNRPVYFVSAAGSCATLGLSEYLQEDGFAYRLVPIRTKNKNYLDEGRVDSEIMYDKLMNQYKWGNMDNPDIWIDHTTWRTTSVIRIRNKFNRLAKQLLIEGQTEKAITVLDKCMEIMPPCNFKHDAFTLEIIDTYIKLGEKEKVNSIIKEFAEASKQEINYLFSMPPKFIDLLEQEQRLAFYRLQQLILLARKNGNGKLAKETENILTVAIQKISNK
ncbi:MAG: DUF2723 domain-containing protein [Bacteroidales bacterium]|nr:DUF2723 domain-containing protein [Bacteroidales bacterium]